MKLMLIKLGKAVNSIKKEGFRVGLGKIFRGLKPYASRIEPGDVLFITNGTGDSARYRAHHVAEELAIHGIKAAVLVQDDPRISRCVSQFKLFIFHRTVETEKMRTMVGEIKRLSKEIIFDADDLTFDPQLVAGSDYLKNINELEKKQYADGLGLFILNDPYVKICTTTTSYLAQRLEGFGKKVFIVPNRLSDEDLKMAEELLAQRTRAMKNKPGGCGCGSGASCPMPCTSSPMLNIGYFSGTPSHNRDFTTIESPLLEILKKHADVGLVIAGPLEISPEFGPYLGRIIRLPYSPRLRHFENLSRIDINLAPLEMNNPFCEAKSEIKFFEAGMLGVPTVAVDNQTFREAIEEGVDGLLAGSEEEWLEKIDRLIMDKNLRKSMGEKARAKTLEKFTNKNSDNEEYYNYLRNHIA